MIDCLKKAGLQLKDISVFVGMAMQDDETFGSRLEPIIKQTEEFGTMVPNSSVYYPNCVYQRLAALYASSSMMPSMSIWASTG